MCHGRASEGGRLTVPREKSRHCEPMCPAGPCGADACAEPFVACRPPPVPPTTCAAHHLCHCRPPVSPPFICAANARLCHHSPPGHQRSLVPPPPTSASFRPRRPTVRSLHARPCSQPLSPVQLPTPAHGPQPPRQALPSAITTACHCHLLSATATASRLSRCPQSASALFAGTCSRWHA